MPLPGIESHGAALQLDHLRALEAESIRILREVIAEFERPPGAAERLARAARGAASESEATEAVRRVLEEILV